MSELSPEERLAALKARRSPRVDEPKPVFTDPVETSLSVVRPMETSATEATSVLWTGPDQAQAPALTQQLPVADTSIQRAAPSSPEGRLNLSLSWNRVAAGGATVVSFASMIVAMGPIFKTVESNEAVAVDANTVDAAAAANPVAPPVQIEVASDPAAGVPAAEGAAVFAPAEVQATDGGTQTPDAVAATPAITPDPQASPESAAPADPAPSSGPTTAPPVTQAPATQAPATAAPTQSTAAAPTTPPVTQAPATQAPATQAPATAAPTTAPPATQAPTTQAPATAAPTTAPPATQAPATTAPPKSEGSGG